MSAAADDYAWPFLNGTGDELFPDCTEAASINVNDVRIHETFYTIRAIFHVCLCLSFIASIFLCAAVLVSVDLSKPSAAFHFIVLFLGISGVVQGSAYFAYTFDEEFQTNPYSYDTWGCSTAAALGNTGMLCQAILLTCLGFESWLLLNRKRRTGQRQRVVAYACGVVVCVTGIQLLVLQTTDGFGNSLRSKLIVWCTIRHANHWRDGASPIGVILGFYMWIMVSWCVCLVFFVLLWTNIQSMLARKDSEVLNPQLQSQLKKLRLKLTIWPLVYLLSWAGAMAHRLVINFVDPCFDLRNTWYSYFVICEATFSAALLPVWNFFLFAVMNDHIREQISDIMLSLNEKKAMRRCQNLCSCCYEDDELEDEDIWKTIANPKRARRWRKQRLRENLDGLNRFEIGRSEKIESLTGSLLSPLSISEDSSSA